MQIRLTPDNAERLKILADANSRTPTAEANIAIKAHTEAHRTEARKGPMERRRK